jgi:hypothetical protein
MGNLNDMLAAFRAEVTHTTGDGRVWWQRGYADQLLYEALSEMQGEIDLLKKRVEVLEQNDGSVPYGGKE